MYTINKKIALAVSLALASAKALAAGSVVFDNSLPGQVHGTTTIVPLTGGTYTIPASHGYVTGTGSSLNLFHSFQTFNVDISETALFTNDLTATYASANFANIISRVTGGTPSTINGTINSTAFSKANFWFVNPSGVTIGSGAVLDVPAGLAIGAADYVNFANGDRWYAIDSNATTAHPSVLSTSSPSSFGFLPATTAGALTLSSSFKSTVAPYVYLEGGSVTDNASISTAPRGEILLVGQQVTIDNYSIITSPNGVIGIAAVPDLSNLTITPVSQTSDFLFGNATAPGATKTALVNSFGPTLGTVTLNNAYVSSGGDSATAGGGGVYVLGGAITLGGSLPSPINLSSTGSWGLDADAGANTSSQSPTTLGVHVYGQSLSMYGNNQIDTVARGGGNTGPIDIALTGDLTLDGTQDALIVGAPGTTPDYGTALFSNAESTGNSGNISIEANNLTLQGPTTAPAPLAPGISGGPGAPAISTQSTAGGKGGDISITLGGTLTMSGYSWVPIAPWTVTSSTGTVGLGGGAITALAEGSAPAGQIKINADSLEIQDAGQIQTATLGSSAAGDVSITLSGHLSIDSAAPPNIGSYPFITGGIFSLSALSCSNCTPSGAPAGNISITSTAAQPSSGYVSIIGSRILSDGSLNQGPSGFVSVSVPGAITITGSTINTDVSSGTPVSQSAGSPVPGSVTLTSTAASITINGASTIETSTSGSLPSGPVTLSGATGLSVTSGSTIQTDTSGGATAGDIQLLSAALINIDDSAIEATSNLSGAAGSIQIMGSGVRVGNQSSVLASYTNNGGNPGGPGTISIQASGSVTSDDPLQADLSAPTAGVVRVVDSGLVALNEGGNTNANGRGTIIVGGTPPTGAPTSVVSASDAVLIAGSVLSTDVGAFGTGAGISVSAQQDLWIGLSPSGGYSLQKLSSLSPNFPTITITQWNKVRPNNAATLLSSTTESTAASGGKVTLTGGNALTADHAVIDAETAIDQNTINNLQQGTNYQAPLPVDVSVGAPSVQLTDTTISTATSGVIDAGQVSLGGNVVSITGGTLATSTTASGNAGDILVASNGTAPAVSNGTPALEIAGGAQLVTTATGASKTAPITGNAGNIQLTTLSGALAVGGVDSSGNQVNLNTSATYAGVSGYIALTAYTGAGAINLDQATLKTNMEGYSPAAGVAQNVVQPGSILVNAETTTIRSATIDASAADSTSSVGGSILMGYQSLVDQEIFGKSISITNSTITAESANTANGGGFVKIGVQGDISGPGSVSLTDTTVSTSATGTGAAQFADQISIGVGGSLTLNNAKLTSTFDGTNYPNANGDGGIISVGATGNVSITNGTQITTTATHSTGSAGWISIGGADVTIDGSQSRVSISSASNNAGAAGDVTIQGTTLSLNATNVSTSTVGSTGNAGTINLIASDADPSGAAALQVTGASVITSDATQSTTAGAAGASNAGTITLTASNAQGSVQIGLSTDTVPTKISSSADSGEGLAGAVTVNAGNAINLGRADIETTANSSTANGTAASITLAADANTPTQTYAPIPISIANSTLNASTSGTQVGGEIDVTGSQITTAGNSEILSQTSGPSKAGDIKITGTTVNMSGTQALVSTSAPGNAGNVLITASGADPSGAVALQITGGSTISSAASQEVAGGSGAGNAGTIDLTASRGSVQLGLAADASQTKVSSSAAGNAGTAGTVTVTAGNAIALGNADVETTAGSNTAIGAPASITLTANNGAGALSVANSLLNASTSGTQTGGEIDLTGSQITISNSQILSGTTGSSKAGNINITGTSVSIDPTTVSTSTNSTGGAGDITITASTGQLNLSDAAITSQSGSQSPSAGAVGVISLSGNSVAITNGSTISVASSGGSPGSSIGSGNAAAAIAISSTGDPPPLIISDSKIDATAQVANGSNILINANGAPVTLMANTRIVANAGGSGAGGNITLSDAGGLSMQNSQITATAAQGTGGNIALDLSSRKAGDTGALQLNGATINATAGGSGNGGNITITGAGQTVLRSTQVRAQANAGNGGAINISFLPTNAPFIKDTQSIVSATSQSGNNGTVAINSPQTDLNSALQTPAVNVAKPPELTANACAPGVNRSSFVREGKGGVSPAPDGYLSAQPSGTEAVGQPSAQGAGARDTQRVAAVTTTSCH